MTWQECKLAALQKMFSAGNTIENDEATNDYLAAMPAAANEAINRIVATRPLRKSAELSADGETRSFDISEVAYDFKNTGSLEVYFVGEDNLPLKIEGARVFAGKYLVLPQITETGTVLFFYDAKPNRITSSTADTYKLPLDEDACSLIPIYIAGELYKDDDMQIATYYMNEFETGLYALVPTDSGVITDTFVSESGW